MPRLKFTDVSQPLEGSNRGRVIQTVEFRAIASPGSLNDWTAPITITATGGIARQGRYQKGFGMAENDSGIKQYATYTTEDIGLPQSCCVSPGSSS